MIEAVNLSRWRGGDSYFGLNEIADLRLPIAD
jgi:hypothetical protein